MTARFGEVFKTALPPDLAEHVRQEARGSGLSESAVLRQAVDLHRTTKRRNAQTEAEIFAPLEGGSY